MLSIPATGAVAAASDRVAGGPVHTVTRLGTARSEVKSVARYVALVTTEAHPTLTLATHWVAHGVTSTLAVTGTVLTVAASRLSLIHI